MENKYKSKKETTAFSLFLRSMVATFAAVSIIVLGYFVTKYFFGEF